MIVVSKRGGGGAAAQSELLPNGWTVFGVD
jgi:hypothetical protein